MRGTLTTSTEFVKPISVIVAKEFHLLHNSIALGPYLLSFVALLASHLQQDSNRVNLLTCSGEFFDI